MTATPTRSIKGTEKALFSLIGDIVCEIPQEIIADRIIKAKVQPVMTKFDIPAEAQKFDGTISYSTLNTVLCEDKDRNEIILDILRKHKDDYTLVLSDRLSQLEYLQEQLGYGIKIDGKMTSKTAKAQREKCIQDMRDGKEHALMASFSLAKEGLDIPRLSVLILASPHKDSATIIQSIRQNRKKI